MKRIIANIFGAFGYLSLLLQWFWAGLTLGFPLFVSDEFQSLLTPAPTTPTVQSDPVSIPEPIAIIFMVLAVIFAVGISIYMLVAVPRTIGRVGKKVTVKSAEAIVPYVTHHEHVSKKRQKTLLERITWSVKLALTLLPVLLLLIPVSEELGLSHTIVASVGLACASFTLLWFGCQFIMAKFGGIDSRDIW